MQPTVQGPSQSEPTESNTRRIILIRQSLFQRRPTCAQIRSLFVFLLESRGAHQRHSDLSLSLLVCEFGAPQLRDNQPTQTTLSNSQNFSLYSIILSSLLKKLFLIVFFLVFVFGPWFFLDEHLHDRWTWVIDWTTAKNNQQTMLKWVCSPKSRCARKQMRVRSQLVRQTHWKFRRNSSPVTLPARRRFLDEHAPRSAPVEGTAGCFLGAAPEILDGTRPVRTTEINALPVLHSTRGAEIRRLYTLIR